MLSWDVLRNVPKKSCRPIRPRRSPPPAWYGIAWFTLNSGLWNVSQISCNKATASWAGFKVSQGLSVCIDCWSPRLAYYCRQLTLICLSVCHVHPFRLLLLLYFSMESSHFWPLVLLDTLYKTLFFDFWFRPLNAQNLLPKICTKSPISRLAWHIERRCLGLPGGFRRWPIQWNHAKCCGADPCCHATKFGLGACRLVYTLSCFTYLFLTF